MKTKIIKIDKTNLPSDEETRMDIIFDYFSDHEIEIMETHTHYLLELSRSNYLYCENVEKGLKWLGIKKEDVKDFHIIEQQSFFCLLESWITYGWSNFMSENLYFPERLTIIHLDDHADLMSPKIIADNGNWKNMFTGQIIDLFEPETVKNAIQSGAITLGSMMTPLIHHIENVNVFHLKQNTKTVERYIEKNTHPDSLIVPENERMAINLNPLPENKSQKYNTYLKTSNLSEIIKNIPPDTDIFLHIDMDFFNNRFNGSTDWINHTLKHNPGMHQQKKVMKNFCGKIFDADLINRIKHVSIGISPSFYPSEYWEEGTAYLLSEFDAVNLNIAPRIKRLILNENIK